jgi:ubiquinone/menaquinone biosynthesis C-methylase UbiE
VSAGAETAEWEASYHSPALVARRRSTYRRKLRRLGIDRLPPGEPVLDVACGSGEFLDLLAADGSGPLVGVDPFRPAVGETAFRRVAGDGCRLPFVDASFRHVLCTHSLHHFLTFERISELLGEVGRVLAPGGRLYLIDHFGSPYLYLLFRLIEQPCRLYPSAVRHFGAQLREERDYIYWWLAHWRRLFDALEEAGLEVGSFRRRLFFFYLVCRPADV